MAKIRFQFDQDSCNVSHFANSIRRLGGPFEYNANLYEHLPIIFMKATYHGSN